MKYVALFFGLVVVSLILSAIMAFPAMLLWNGCLVPAVPAITEVSWLQMWGIMILVGVVFRTSTASAEVK